MYMPTLPSTFNSLVGKTVKIETEEPQNLIELLGGLLGVTDYKTNKAAFWFLDTIALQVLRYKNCLDDHYRSVLISWLAGEMKLIRDEKLSREDFFKKMKIFFLYVAENISSGNQLLHWELIVNKCPKFISTNFTIDESLMNGTEYSITNKSSNEKLVSENNAALELKPSLIAKTSRDSENSNKSLQPKSSKNFQTPINIDNSQIDSFIDTNVVVESSNLTHLNTALDAIIGATYNMYANELRYALIYAVFVTPIQIQICHMPHCFRTPRQIKVAGPEGSFDIQLRERLEKIVYESTIDNGKKHKGKKTTNSTKKERGVKEDLNIKVPATSPSSLIDEEILVNNCQCILPLIEAKEAAQIHEMHAENMKQG
ncbi:unnamed protein product [Lasius platythorax]